MNDHDQRSGDIEIISSTAVSEQALGDFYQQMYPQRADFLQRHWRWLYRVDEFPQLPAPLVAVLNGRVIGHVAQIPVIIKSGRWEKFAAWSVDGGVLESYRGSGIGWQLMQRWTQGYDIGMGFCTEALFRILIKQGWSPRTTATALHLPLRPERHPRFQKGSWAVPMRLVGPMWSLVQRMRVGLRRGGREALCELPLSPQRLERWSLLHHPKELGEPLHVARSSEFLRWRLLSCPFRDEYRILEMKGADLATIVRVFGPQNWRRARIIALSGRVSSEDDISIYFGSLAAWAIEQKLDMLSVVNSDPTVIRLAHRWFPIKSQMRYVSVCRDAKDHEMFRDRDHIWELIDYDLDFIP